MQRVVVLTCDDSLIPRCKHELEPDCFIEPRLVHANDPVDLRDQLRDCLGEITGTTDGNIAVDCVISDAIFRPRTGRPYFIGENIFDDLPQPAGSTMATILGAGVPLLVNVNTPNFVFGFKVGMAGAKCIDRTSLRSQVRKAVEAVKFNRHTLAVENEFAKVYDEEELSGAATISAILFENEYVLERVRRFSEQSPGPLRVLDLGCGTGRFEEVLLADAQISKNIEQIVAVDFAPMYIIQAEHRLRHFLDDQELCKVRFLRRIAEDLQWPSDYFDLVIASFGIVCFSRTYLTLLQILQVLKPQGLAIFIGYNRDAITYRFDKVIGRTDQPVTHFAIHIDRDKNLMYLGDSTIRCTPFSVDNFTSILRTVGFHPVEPENRTFPILYGAARREYIESLRNSSTGKLHSSHACCQHLGDCDMYASYQSVNLTGDQRKSDFNEIIHRMDSDLEKVLAGKGFYFYITAYKKYGG